MLERGKNLRIGAEVKLKLKLGAFCNNNYICRGDGREGVAVDMNDNPWSSSAEKQKPAKITVSASDSGDARLLDENSTPFASLVLPEMPLEIRQSVIDVVPGMSTNLLPRLSIMELDYFFPSRAAAEDEKRKKPISIKNVSELPLFTSRREKKDEKNLQKNKDDYLC